METICPNQTLLQRAVTSCSLFNIISDIAELIQTVTGVKCLLYAGNLNLLWYSVPKKDAQKRMESVLNNPLKPLANCINPHLMYKDTFLEQTNESTYLGMTLDTKLSWKNHTARIAERASNRLNLLKRLAGSIWGCACSTLNTTYKMFVQKIML